MALWFDPLPALAAAAEKSAELRFFVRRDLLGEQVGRPEDELWSLPGAKALLRRQRADGAFPYPGGGKKDQPFTNYALVETFRQLRLMVCIYEMDRGCPGLERAAGFVFSCQAPGGDIRGIIGNQFMPYYHGALLALLVRAGYGDDARVASGLAWLLETRQDDGGWVVPAQTVPSKARTGDFWRGPAVAAPRHAPSSHIATGMVLPALAAHPQLRRSEAAAGAAALLKSRVFQADRYGDRKAPAYWTKFQYPFWWPNILTLLTTLAELGEPASDPAVAACVDWFHQNQEPDGLWPTGYGHGARAAAERCWVGLAATKALQHWIGPVVAR